MTKQEYIEQLSRALNRFSEQTKAEVLEDYEAHFSIGLENGRTEDEICCELGPIDLFIEELSQMEPVRDTEKQTDAWNASKPYPSAQQTTALTQQAAPTADSGRESRHSETAEPSEYHSSTAKTLILNGLHADVTLTPSADGLFHIYYENSGTAKQKMQYRFYFREENGVIHTGIRKSKTASGLFGSLLSPSITLSVQIPPAMTEVNAATVSGEIEAAALRLPMLSLSSTSGDLTCSDTDTQSLKLSTTSGEIDCSGIASPRLEAASVSGDAEISGRFAFCGCSTVSGDIDLTTVYDCTLQLNTVSGDIDICPQALINGDAGTVSGDIEINLSGTQAGLTVDFSTVSGDFDISCPCTMRRSRRSGHAEIPGNGNGHLTLSTTSGDLTIN